MKHLSSLKMGVSASLVVVLATSSGAASAAPVSVQSLSELVKGLLEYNDSIQSKHFNKRIADAEVEKSLAKFDPQFDASIVRSRQEQPNTTDDKKTQQESDVFESNSTDYSAKVSKLLASGAQVELKLTTSDFMTSAIQIADPDVYEPNYRRTYYGLSVTQPLMRDAGVDVNRASVKWAELDSDAAGSDQLDTSSAVVAQGLLLFYDLQLAHQQERIEQEKVTMAKRLLKLAKDAGQAGRASRSETWDVENSLSRFEVSALQASQNRIEQTNRLKSMLMADTDLSLNISADLLPNSKTNMMSRDELVQSALNSRADFKRQQLTLKRVLSQREYADNQRMPRLDLTASYGQNGLAHNWHDAISSGDTPAWSLGLQFSVPLGINREGNAAYDQAQARVDEAQMVLNALQVSIENDIDSSIRLIENVGQRWDQWELVNKREQEQLLLERQRLKSGRSDLRELLFKEERALNAQLSLAEQRVSYAKAQVLQHAAVGTLLNHYAAF